MHNIMIRILLIIMVLTTVIYCQGGGGSRSSGGSRGMRSRSSRNSCTGDACRQDITVVEYITMGTIAVIYVSIVYYGWKKGKPTYSNEVYVNLPSTEMEHHDSDQFLSGFWSSRYYQYGVWHGPFQFSLVFDSEMSKVTGSGLDNIGEYTIEGVYFTQTNRIGLTKTYRKGTGNPAQNLGHNVIIQAAWNSSQHHFEGKWFVRTSKYSGEAKFELKLEKSY